MSSATYNVSGEITGINKETQAEEKVCQMTAAEELLVLQHPLWYIVYDPDWGSIDGGSLRRKDQADVDIIEQSLTAESASIDVNIEKMNVGVEVDGVMCSLHDEDQVKLIAVKLAMLSADALGVTYSQPIKFVNDNVLTLTNDASSGAYYKVFESIWLPARAAVVGGEIA